MSSFPRRTGIHKNVPALKHEPKAHNARLSIVQKAQDIMVCDDLSCSENGVDDNHFDEGQQQVRASSPLDTIAAVACRLGAEIPVTTKSKVNENTLPRNAYGQGSPRFGQGTGGSQSPASIPTGETANTLMPELAEKMDEITGDTNVSLRSLLRLLEHYKFDRHNSERAKGQWDAGVDRMDGREMIGKLCEDLHNFKHAVESKVGEQVREMRQMKEEMSSLRRNVAMLQSHERDWHRGPRIRGLNAEEYGREENVVSLRTDDGDKVCFIVRGMNECEDDVEGKDEEEVAVVGNELRIGVGSSGLGKRAIRSEDMVSTGSEDEVGCDKRVRRMTRGESVTGTESICKSDVGDWNDGEKTIKRSRGGKGGKGKGSKRRRDNWTEEENNEFMSMVVENQDIEEMSLRRMLARRFSPRRTHEQCANHLRILRAQKKLPPAKEEVDAKKKESCETNVE